MTINARFTRPPMLGDFASFSVSDASSVNHAHPNSSVRAWTQQRTFASHHAICTGGRRNATTARVQRWADTRAIFRIRVWFPIPIRCENWS